MQFLEQACHPGVILNVGTRKCQIAASVVQFCCKTGHQTCSGSVEIWAPAPTKTWSQISSEHMPWQLDSSSTVGPMQPQHQFCAVDAASASCIHARIFKDATALCPLPCSTTIGHDYYLHTLGD